MFRMKGLIVMYKVGNTERFYSVTSRYSYVTMYREIIKNIKTENPKGYVITNVVKL